MTLTTTRSAAVHAADEHLETDDAWHARSVDETTSTLGSDPSGLTDGEATARRARIGPNELRESGSKSPLRILWEQVTAVMVVILIAASALSFVLGKTLEGIAILTIIVLFAALGFFQEYRAERAIAALRSMSAPTVRVRRAGVVQELSARELVPGDVVLLEAGNVVPADLRLIEVVELRVQEAALTGESEPVDKQTDAIPDLGAPLGDRKNMAYAGTQVVYGRGAGMVVATGMGTELGRVAELLQSVSGSATPLQQRLDRVGKQLAIGGVVVALLVVLIGALAGESLTDLVVTAISVAVAVIPEGLPAVVTFTLAIGAQRMVRRHALIRTLPAVETLGSVTVICSDKTGTLTENRMTAVALEGAAARAELGTDAPAFGAGDPGLRLALLGGALCSDAELHTDTDGNDASVGDPTELALVRAGAAAGVDIDRLRAELPRICELPFDSERKCMTTVRDTRAATRVHLTGVQGRYLAFVKGAPDRLIDQSARVRVGDRVVDMDAELRQRLEAANERAAGDGMRVLAVAYRELPHRDALDAALAEGTLERELTFAGLFSIVDPPRPEVASAVETAKSAGIRPIMITGDHPLTAVAIARELGITGTDVVTGREIDAIDDDVLADRVQNVSVFARVAPEHKLRIVEALQRQGQVVAMTGDGVNDAPALKRADIGVAMGITGTDVSKEASDIVLRDDNFATIVAAVEEGRVIYDNLRRFVRFAVAGNVGKMIVMLGWPIPFLVAGTDPAAAVALLPLQLLWLNLMTDGLLGLSMGLEPAERGVMSRAPHAPGSSIWSGGLGRQVLWTGAAIGLVALGVGYAYFAADDPRWQSMMFTTIAVLQVFQALATRSSAGRLGRGSWRSNPALLLTVGLVLAFQMAALYTPLAGVLDLEPLRLADLALVSVLGFALFGALDLSARRARSPLTAPRSERTPDATFN